MADVSSAEQSRAAQRASRTAPMSQHDTTAREESTATSTLGARATTTHNTQQGDRRALHSSRLCSSESRVARWQAWQKIDPLGIYITLNRATRPLQRYIRP